MASEFGFDFDSGEAGLGMSAVDGTVAQGEGWAAAVAQVGGVECLGPESDREKPRGT